MNTSDHPVSFVQWVPTEKVTANDYNPNSVAPPEMKLLEVSIKNDGFTQPIVVWMNGDMYEVVDGFHRHLVGKKLGMTHLPVVIINKDRQGRGDRIAATIRHNRARGKHKVEAMSDIVIELKRRNWSTERICRDLGMDEDEVLRLCQITGLADLFNDSDFSKSWDIKDSAPDFQPLTDEVDVDEKEELGYRTINTDDPDRIFHTYEKWECHKAGFYANVKNGKTKEEHEAQYAAFLKNDKAFRKALKKVISEWKNSCEHYLTNASMNRIAWLGQAACCYAKGIPSVYRAGFHLLSEDEQLRANKTALEFLNKWLKKNKRKLATIEEAMPDRQATIY